MRAKKSFFTVLAFVVLFALSYPLNFKYLGDMGKSEIKLENLLNAYKANAESADDCNGPSCSPGYDYNDLDYGTPGCCNKYTTSTGQRG